MNLIFDIFISTIVAALAAPVGGALGFGVGLAVVKLGNVDGPPAGVGVMLSVGSFGVLFGACAFVVCLGRRRKRANSNLTARDESTSHGA